MLLDVSKCHWERKQTQFIFFILDLLVIHWNDLWLKMLIKTTVVLKLFRSHLRLKLVLCSYVWVRTPMDLQSHKRLSKLWSWNVRIKSMATKNMFSFCILEVWLMHFIVMREGRTTWAPKRRRQCAMSGRQLIVLVPNLLFSCLSLLLWCQWYRIVC